MAFTGLVCPTCREPVAVVEHETPAMTYCKACGNHFFGQVAEAEPDKRLVGAEQAVVHDCADFARIARRAIGTQDLEDTYGVFGVGDRSEVIAIAEQHQLCQLGFCASSLT